MRTRLLSIAFNGSMLDDHPTGVGIYTYNLINSFSALYPPDVTGRVTVFTPSISFLSKNIDVVKIPAILKSSAYGRLAALSRFLWNTLVYPWQVRQYDLLISPTTHGSFFANNQVIAIHDLISLKYNNISTHQRIYFKYLLPKMVAGAKAIITVSENSKTDIIKLLDCPAEKVTVVYNGFDSNRFFVTPQPAGKIEKAYGVKNYLLALGATYPHKNFELLIDAYRALDSDTRAAHPLVIAGGKKKYLDTLQLYASQYSECQIIFTGYVPNDLMQPLYSEAAALVFPSLYEGFGIPLLEAMACGCPVICSNTSSMPEVCGDAALYFDPLNKTMLTTAIIQLLSNQDLQNELTQKGVVQATKFSWKQSAIALQAVIENITSKN